MKLDTGFVIRTLCLVVALINQALTATGHTILPFDDDMITQVVTLTFTVATAGVSWWKNNNVSEAAKAGQLVTDAIKNGTATVEDAAAVAARQG